MTADACSSVQRCDHRFPCNQLTLRPFERVGTDHLGGNMDGYWLAVALELGLLTLLVAMAMWALFDADRLRALWIAERERRVNGSRECTCGAYRRC